MKRRLLDIAFWALLVFALYRAAPLWWNSSQQEGKTVEEVKAIDLSGSGVTLPVTGEKAIYVLWATWCGPCHQQLALFKNAVEDGKLSAQKIVALSIGEPLEHVRAFQEKEKYPFRVLADPSGAATQIFRVSATPTIVFIDENKTIDYFTAGLSPLAVTRAKSFLGD